ncbi:MAG: spore cortex-lytic protein [Oscillospiraceae bacterium]
MSSFGTLSVWVYTARGALPVADAEVTITQRDPVGTPRIVAQRVTDESGTALPISFQTPTAAESLSPGTLHPFTVCTVTVNHPDYRPAVIADVQVFPMITTVQQVGLVPLAEHQPRFDATRTVLVTPQGL